MREKNVFILIIILIYRISLFAQVQENLPKWITSEEKPFIAGYAISRAYATDAITVPPDFPIRTMAEWEEIQALFITWKMYPDILRQIVKEAQTECMVVIVCADSNAVKTDLSANAISLTNVAFLQEESNTIWMRDYGGNTIYKNEVEDLMFVDWIYNRPRPKDDIIPEAIATQFGLPHYATTQAPYDLVHTGGNFMTDGLGTAFSSDLVLNENLGTGYSLTPKTASQIDTIMHHFMGIAYGRYIKMDILPYDGIHHIDMHMKLIDEQTLLVGEYPTGVSDGPQIDANIQYVLNNYNTPFGTPYKVVRIPMPPEGGNYPNSGGDYRTYTNLTFVNKKILLPVYEMQYDTMAIRILGEHLPGYKIATIDCNSIIQQSGALHCITHSVGVPAPLLITHQPLGDTYNNSSPYAVTAAIRHQSGIANAIIQYRVSPSNIFFPVTMTQILGTNEWVGEIPPQPVGSKVEYYITATANSGKSMQRPITAPVGVYDFEVKILSSAAPPETFASLYTPFPNPASDILTIPVTFDYPVEGKLILYDIVGQEVLRLYEGKLFGGNRRFSIDTREFPQGMYFVSLQTIDKVVTKKVFFMR